MADHLHYPSTNTGTALQNRAARGGLNKLVRRTILLAAPFFAALLMLFLPAAVAHRLPPSLLPQTSLLRPVTPACVSSPFGPRFLPNLPVAGAFHNGIDLPAPAGAPVRAVAPGEVIRVQRRGPGGLESSVQHSGFIGVYSHFGSVARRSPRASASSMVARNSVSSGGPA